MILYINTDGGNAHLDAAGDKVKTASAFTVSLDPIEPNYAGRSDVASLAITGIGTTNTAEYGGVLLALLNLDRLLEEYDETETVQFYLDSQVVTRHITGMYKCKEPELKVLLEQVHSMENIYPWLQFRYTWVRRDFNKFADQLCDLALEDCIKTNLFQPIADFVPSKKDKKLEPSLGQLWRAGLIKTIVTCRVSADGAPICNRCKDPWVECSCPPLNMEEYGREEAVV